MVHIQLRQGASLNQEDLREIGRTLQEHEGFLPVAFTFEDIPGEELRAGGLYHVEYSKTLMGKLGNLPLVKKAWIS